MNKLEFSIIRLFVGIACPLLVFTAFWWFAAMLHMHVSGFPLNMVKALALAGLAIGLMLDVFFLRNWTQRLYMANLWLISVCYLGLCIVSVAFFMGLPVGTFALGIIAGVYMGRRESHALEDSAKVVVALRRTALMAATVTATASLPIGILALNERDILYILKSLPGLSQVSLQGWAGFALICLLCVFLFFIQYWFSQKAGLLAYGIGKRNVQQSAGEDGADQTSATINSF